MKYDAFISYSHAADGQFVSMLRNELQRFATPWGPFRWTNPVRALRIFQDMASLSANPALWPTIEQALIGSEWFILLASPESARSEWVDKEIDLWCRDKRLDRLLIVQTGGDIAWDHAANDFDWLKTNALSSRTRGVFPVEPRWVDARFGHSNQPVTKADPRLRDLVAELAAPLRGVPKDDLIGEDIRQHRRLSRWRSVAIVVLAILLVFTAIAAKVALEQRNLAEQRRIETEQQLHVSEYRRLAAQATSAEAFDLALLLAIEATRFDDNRETRHALLDVVQSQRFVRSFFFDRPESGRQTPIRHIKISPDGQFLATSGREGVLLWDTHTHQLLAQLGEGPVSAIEFISNGTHLATLSRGTMSVWDMNTHRLAAPSSEIETSEPYASAFTSDGVKLAVAASNESIIRLSEIAGGSRTSVGLSGHSKYVTSLVFTPDNKVLASGSGDNTVILWDVINHRALGTPLLGHKDTVRSLAVAPDGKTLASGSDDGEIILWDLSTHKQLGSPLTGHFAATYALAFSRDGSMLASGGADRSVLLWDLKTRTRISDPLRTHLNAVWGLAFEIGDESVLSSGDDGRIVEWDFREPRVAGTVLSAHTTGIRNLAFSPNGKLIATVGSDGSVIIWETRSGQQVGKPLVGHKARIGGLAFDSSASTLALGGDDGTIALWKVDTHEPIGSPLKGSAAVLQLEFGSGDQRLNAVYQNGTSINWDIKAGHEVTSTPTPADIPGDQPNLAEWSRTGYLTTTPHSLAQLNEDAGLKHWAVARNNATVAVSNDFVFRGHTKAVNIVAFSPDGNMVASGSNDTTAILWNLDLATWQHLACEIANRNLTRSEYDTYLGRNSGDYVSKYAGHPSCPDRLTEIVGTKGP